MLLNHLAAMLFFGGPLFYVGLWMLIDAAAITGAVSWVAPRFTAPRKEIPKRVRIGIRFAGVLLLLLAIAL